jgi:hypothetical protein
VPNPDTAKVCSPSSAGVKTARIVSPSTDSGRTPPGRSPIQRTAVWSTPNV